eukprot:5810945-Pyramimonas_sp.AAC.1
MGRAGQSATPVLAGMPAFNLASLAAAGSLPAVQQPTAPPIQREIGGSTLERETRIMSSATPIISD